jgi:hypothetical protein
VDRAGSVSSGWGRDEWDGTTGDGLTTSGSWIPADPEERGGVFARVAKAPSCHGTSTTSAKAIALAILEPNRSRARIVRPVRYNEPRTLPGVRLDVPQQ